MKIILPLVSTLGLLLVLGPVIAYALGLLDKPRMSDLMLLGTILWFASVPWWIGVDKSGS